MTVSNKPWGTPIARGFLDAGVELGFNIVDPNAEKQTGM